MNKLKALVVGGGIAGLSCAVALCRAGHDVHLVERDKSWSTYPTGISLQGHTYRAFRKIGVADEVAELGYPSGGSRLRRADGTLIREVRGEALEPGLPIAGGIMRPVLQDILVRKANELGARISLGLSFVRIENQPSEVDVEFSDGEVESYDVVVGADGVFSKVRSCILPEAPQPRYTGQACFRTTVARPAEIDMMTMYLGNPIKAGLTPASNDLLFLWTLTPEPTDDWLSSELQLPKLKQALSGFGGAIGDIRDALEPRTEIIYRPLKVIMVPPPWHSGRVVLIGDAVHATTPHLTSGASACVEDAWILAEHLSKAASVDVALCEFTERRYERCRFVVETSARIGEMEVAGAPSSEQEQLFAHGLEVLSSPA